MLVDAIKFLMLQKPDFIFPFSKSFGIVHLNNPTECNTFKPTIEKLDHLLIKQFKD